MAEVRFYAENLEAFHGWLKSNLKPGYALLASGFSVVVLCSTKDDAWRVALWAYHQYPGPGRVRFRVKE